MLPNFNRIISFFHQLLTPSPLCQQLLGSFTYPGYLHCEQLRNGDFSPFQFEAPLEQQMSHHKPHHASGIVASKSLRQQRCNEAL